MAVTRYTRDMVGRSQRGDVFVMETEYMKLRAENARLTAELADRASPEMVFNLKATIRQLTDEIAELRAQEPVGKVVINDDGSTGFECDALIPYGTRLYARPVPAAQAVPAGGFALMRSPITERMLNAIRAAQQPPADQEPAATQPSTPVSLTGNSTPESFAVPEWMPRLYSWLARAKFDNVGDEVTAALYGNHLRDLIAANHGEAPLGIVELREVETRYLADLLSNSIANLGYPVGCGIPPSDDHAMKAAAALFDRFVNIAAAMQKGGVK